MNVKCISCNGIFLLLPSSPELLMLLSASWRGDRPCSRHSKTFEWKPLSSLRIIKRKSCLFSSWENLDSMGALYPTSNTECFAKESTLIFAQLNSSVMDVDNNTELCLSHTFVWENPWNASPAQWTSKHFLSKYLTFLFTPLFERHGSVKVKTK